MPVYKANFFFSQRQLGWSETWFLDRVDASAALTSMIPLVPLRVGMLGGNGLGASDPRLKQVRVSNINIERDSLVYAVPPADQFTSSLLGVADSPHLALITRCEAGDLYRRTWFLRGFPDVLVADNGAYLPSPIWSPRFDAFVDALKARTIGMVAASRAAPVLLISFLATEAGPNPLKISVTTTVPHLLAIGDKFRIVSAPGAPEARGTWTVFEVGSPTTVTFFIRKALSGSYRGGGTMYKKTPTLFQFTNLQVERVSHRITGRPFDQLVGRRRSRAAV